MGSGSAACSVRRSEIAVLRTHDMATVNSHGVLQYFVMQHTVYCMCFAPCIMPSKHLLSSLDACGAKKCRAITIEVKMDMLKHCERGEQTADLVNLLYRLFMIVQRRSKRMPRVEHKSVH